MFNNFSLSPALSLSLTSMLKTLTPQIFTPWQTLLRSLRLVIHSNPLRFVTVESRGLCHSLHIMAQGCLAYLSGKKYAPAHISVSVVCSSCLCQDASKLNFCVSVRRPSLLSSTPAHRNQKENWVRGEVGHVHRACSVQVCLRGRVRTGGLRIPQVNSASVIFSDQQNTFEMLEKLSAFCSDLSVYFDIV